MLFHPRKQRCRLYYLCENEENTDIPGSKKQHTGKTTSELLLICQYQAGLDIGGIS
jgi:hypothetical protein